MSQPRDVAEVLRDAAVGERMGEQGATQLLGEGDGVGARHGAATELRRGGRLDGDHVDDMLIPPRQFPPLEGRWANLALTPEEFGAKRVALMLYHSQVLVIGRLVLAFATHNELFIEGEPASVPECWCNGQNVATEATPSRYRHPPPKR